MFYPLSFMLDGNYKVIFLDEPPRYAGIDVLPLCEDDGICHAFLLVGVMATSATDKHIAVCEDDGFHFPESVLSHLCHSKPFYSGALLARYILLL